MKTAQQINEARRKLRERLQTPGMNDVQKALVGGMLNALVWVAEAGASATIDRLLSEEPIAAGKDPRAALDRLAYLGEATTSKHFTCERCGGQLSHSRLRGLFCMQCD